VRVDQQRPWLLRQVDLDSRFLEGLRVLDYSLLVAQQPLHPDERRPALAALITRTKRSVCRSSWGLQGSWGSAGLHGVFRAHGGLDGVFRAHGGLQVFMGSSGLMGVPNM